MFESLFGYVGWLGGTSGKRENSTGSSTAFAAKYGSAHIYNEQAFALQLLMERKRVALVGRPLLLVLVSLRSRIALTNRIPPALAKKVISRLATCVREVDFIGWYREGRILAAVLTQGPDPPPADAKRRTAERITAALCSQLSADSMERLQIRVLQLRGGRRAEHGE